MGFAATKINIGGQKFNYCDAPSYGDLLDYLRKVIDAGGFSGASQQYNTYFGEATYEHAERLAREGWASGLERVNSISEALGTVVGQYIKKVEFHYDVAGSTVDVGRYLSGEPECMMEFHEEVRRSNSGRIVNVTVDIGMAGVIGSDVIFNRGAAVVALVDALETAGLVAEINLAISNGYKYTHPGQKPFYFLVPLKKAGEALEMDRLAYALCHKAMYRRHIFCWQESQTNEIRKQMGVSDTYGSSSYHYPPELVEDGEIVVPSLGYNEAPFRTQQSAIAWVLEHLRTLGVLIEEKAL